MLETELSTLRRAHEAQARHLIAERLVLAEQIEQEVGHLREELEWRKEVMEEQGEALEYHKKELEISLENHKKEREILLNSRSFRYTAPLRRIVSFLRR